MNEMQALERELEELQGALAALQREIAARFLGHAEQVEQLACALLAGGHVLLEGAPGLGKTTLARCLAGALGLSFRRIQCTPDLMPADVLGTRVLEEDALGRRFVFERGPVFTHVLLADELNRATPRTQSALLEAMQERQVTVFGESLPLEEPFFVIATQNPVEMEGTYPLPEAQIDRFLLELEIGQPSFETLVAILEGGEAQAPPIEPVMSRAQLLRLRALASGVPASSDALALVARTVLATHPGASAPERVSRYVRYGASPRGAQALLAAARARALAAGRLHVGLEDVRALAVPALAHRLILNYEGEAAGVRASELVGEALARAARE